MAIRVGCTSITDFIGKQCHTTEIDRPNQPIQRIIRTLQNVVPTTPQPTCACSCPTSGRTIELLARQVSAAVQPVVPRQRAGSDIAAEFDRKIFRYKQALDEGASPAVVAAWIAEAEQRRDTALANRPAAREVDAADSMTAEDIASLAAELGDIATALDEAPPEHKLDLYRSLRLKLIYSAETQTVHAIIDLGGHRWDLVRVRGGN